MPDRAADAMGRAPSTGSGPALRARRERPSRPSPGRYRPAGPASSPSVAHFLSRLPRAAARLALAALLLAGAGAVAAPASADVLVSNIGQSSSDGSLLANVDVAQRFTTGSHPAGYTLSSIELRIRTGSELAGWIVKLFSGSANGTKVADFGPAAGIEKNTTKNYTFTPSGSVTLAKDTDYWVVLEGNSGEWFSTDADDEDGASESDWSIRNVHESRGASQTGSFSDGSAAALIRVNGHEALPTASDGRVETPENVNYTFSAGDFNFVSVDADHTLASVKIVTLPGAGKGSLKLDGSEITASQLPKTVTKDELDNDKLVYDPPADSSGNDFASFTYKVNDGDNDSDDAYTMTVDVDKAPDVTQVAVTSTPRAETTDTPPVRKYGVGQKIQITVTFDEAVVVTGDPEFAIRMGDSVNTIATKDAAYVRGSGTTELVFEYTVLSGDRDTDGIWIDADALDLDSDDKIRDGADNDADLAHAQLGRQTGHKVDGSLTPDTTAPTVIGADVNEQFLDITFDENLDTSSAPPSSAFTVKKTPAGSNTAQRVIPVRSRIIENYVALTLPGDVLRADKFTVSYTKPSTSSHRLKDAFDNEVASFTDLAVNNVTSARLVFSETGLDVVEGGTAEYTVKLDSEPVRNFTLTVARNVSDPAAVTVHPASLTFTTTNWNIPQTVTVTGVQDANRAHETVRISHYSSEDEVFSRNLTVKTIEDDYIVNVRALDVAVNEGDGSAEFEISLEPAPRHRDIVFFVHWWTEDGTAVEHWGPLTGGDYIGVGGGIGLGNNGLNEPTFREWVRINDDSFDESFENFRLHIALGFGPEQTDIVSPTSAPAWVKALNVTVGTASAEVTITLDDNDDSAVATLRAPGGRVGGEFFEGDEDAAFGVWLVTTYVSAFTVDYEVREATRAEAAGRARATAGVDFVAKRGTLTFQPRETYKTVPLEVPRTPELEPDEIIAVELSNPGSDVKIAESLGLGFWRVYDNPGPYRTRLRVRSGAASEDGGCPVELRVEFRDGNGDLTSVDALTATSFTVENGRLGTPVADADGLRWTVPAWSTRDFTGLMRVRLLEKVQDAEGRVVGWEAAEKVVRVAGESDCAAVAGSALGALSLDGLTLDPAFDAATRSYAATAPEETATTTVRATAVYETSEVTVTPGDADEVTEGHQVALAPGETEVTVRVRPADGSAAKTWTVTVTRETDPGVLEGFVLVAVPSDVDLGAIRSGATVAVLAESRYGIRAEVETGAEVGSVVLSLAGPGETDVHERTENTAPYSLYGNAEGAEHGRTLAAGSYTLTATAYSGSGGAGDEIGMLVVPFTVTTPLSAGVLEGFVLVDASTDADAGAITSGATVEVSADGSYGIRAEVEANADVGSVTLSLAGPGETDVHERTENSAPYSLYGDTEGAEHGQALAAGSYTLTATAYSGSGGAGNEIGTLEVSFTVAEEAAPSPGVLTGLVLVDASTDADAGAVTEGATVEVSPDGSYGLRAEVEANAEVGSVVLSLAGPGETDVHERTENTAPYSLYGDAEGAEHGRALAVGSYTLTATAYAESGGAGDEMGTLEVSFTVAVPPSPGVLTGFVLVDASSDTDLGTLTDGGTGEVSADGSYGLRAEVEAGAEVGSVVLSLAGPGDADVHERTENAAPYSLYGDAEGAEHGQALAAGSYTLTATAYAESGGAGDELGTLSVSFTVTLAAAPSNALTGFVLVDASTDADAGAVTGGDTVEVSSDGSYGLRAEVDANAEVGSVVLSLAGPGETDVHERTESAAPYSLYGDSEGAEHGRALAAGSYTLTATAYAESGGAGDELGTLEVAFTVALAPPPDPDATRAGAVSLGAQSPSNGRQYFRDKSLDRAAGDAVDYYTFTTDGRYALGLGVRDQSVELAVTLEDATGTTVGTAGPPANPDLDQLYIEWLKQTIASGTYYIRVEALADGATDYYVRFGLEAPPPELSVADARAEEGTDASLDFAVTLDPESTGEVTVDYATADGTATAGDDYTATSGTLTFAAGETSKTVSVPVLEDNHDEGSETLTLRLSNAQGATIADGEATGTIANSDAIPEAWLARFGRTVTGQVLDAVEARLAAPRQAGAEMSLAGQALPSWRADGNAAAANPGAGDDARAAAAAERKEAEARAALASMTAWLAQTGPDSGSDSGTAREPESRALTGRDFITGTSFALTGGSAEGGGFASLWGRGSIAGFDGREGALTVDGEVTTGLIGADWSAGPEAGPGRWTAGLALGHSTGTGGWRGADGSGRIEATLSGLYPYAGMTLTERLTLWAAAGHGAGEVTVTPAGEAGLTGDLTLAMGAAGVRSEVLRPVGGNGLSLAVKGDARFTRTSSEAVRGGDGNLAAADADVWLLRTGVEGSRPVALGDGGATLTPSFEIGLRLDGGDAETGLGADLGGGVAFADPKNGVALDLRARGLVAHAASGFREWGASFSGAWDPRPETDLGFALTLRQSWGAAPTGGMDALLSRETLAGLAANDDGSGRFEAAGRLEGEVGYGVAAFGGGFTGTPNAGFGISENARDWRVGWRLGPAGGLALDFELSLDATRREPANDDGPPEQEVMLRAAIRW